ncbi:MAG: hypothetical protein ACD_78C00100G0003 [uncultured bacterium (gcode 4)]|uniref:Arginine--tRNA ligase n=1 Tax=uncultured bacterium (gcode 4) TaxID=1234023 RepID=K1XIV3_9BACT|nr:MAG: hypothetical protein ACD_78C00100G0003 [uncultured bacterium (gcode 4)]
MSVIEQILLDIVVSVFPETLSLFEDPKKSSISLDVPPKKELGDFALNVFPYAKITKLAPPVVAEKFAEGLRNRPEYFKEVSIMGGYVNFFLTNVAWADIFNSLSIEDKPKKNETVVVDYIGANAGKPLHIGHVCTPSIGQTILNTHKYLGYNIIGDSHFGDWGGIFGALICIWKENVKLDKEEHVNYQLGQYGVQYLVAMYQRFHGLISNRSLSPEANEQADRYEAQAREEFKKLSQWDPENVELWKKFTAISISEANKKLEFINVQPQYNIGESFYEGLDLPRPNNEDYPDLKDNMKDIVRELIEKGVATQNEDGSVGVIFPEETKIPSCVLQKKDGTGLYLTSDLAAIKYRLTNGWNPSKIIYCVDSRQQLHLKQAFTIARMAWPELLKDVELFHAFNGFIKLKEGAMSTRKGTVIFLSDLIDEGFNRTKAILEEKGQELSKEDIEAISIGAIKYSYLAQDREKDVVFDWDKALSFEGNSGPYIQYSYVRAKNIIDKAGEIGAFKTENLALSEYDRACLRRLSFFDKAVLDSVMKYKPHILASYCYELASEFNAFYVHTPKILEETDTNLKNFRLNLIQKVMETLEKWFELLAIKMPGKM